MTVGILQDNLQNVKFCERGLETWTSVVNIWLQSWQVWLCTCSMEGELKFTCEAETVYLSESSSVDCSYAWELDVQLSVTLLQMMDTSGYWAFLCMHSTHQHLAAPEEGPELGAAASGGSLHYCSETPMCAACSSPCPSSSQPPTNSVHSDTITVVKVLLLA